MFYAQKLALSPSENLQKIKKKILTKLRKKRLAMPKTLMKPA
jgi:hypothetical protein